MDNKDNEKLNSEKNQKKEENSNSQQQNIAGKFSPAEEEFLKKYMPSNTIDNILVSEVAKLAEEVEKYNKSDSTQKKDEPKKD